MTSQQQGADTVLTGLLSDRSALYGVLTEIEALGLDLIELRKLVPQYHRPFVIKNSFDRTDGGTTAG